MLVVVVASMVEPWASDLRGPGSNLASILFFLRSAFFWFSKEVRPKVRAANPEFSVGEIAKELGRRWSEATPESKSK